MFKIIWLFFIILCVVALWLGRKVIKESYKKAQNEIESVANEINKESK